MFNKTTNELKAIMRENKVFHDLVLDASAHSEFVGVGALNRSDLYNQARNELHRRGEI